MPKAIYCDPDGCVVLLLLYTTRKLPRHICLWLWMHQQILCSFCLVYFLSCSFSVYSLSACLEVLPVVFVKKKVYFCWCLQRVPKCRFKRRYKRNLFAVSRESAAFLVAMSVYVSWDSTRVYFACGVTFNYQFLGLVHNIMLKPESRHLSQCHSHHSIVLWTSNTDMPWMLAERRLNRLGFYSSVMMLGQSSVDQSEWRIDASYALSTWACLAQ